MEKSNSGMHGHGMPIETKNVPHEPAKRNGSEMPTKGTTTTTIHESKNFPFQIVEVTITEDHKKEQKFFQIGVAGQIMSKTKFSTLENAESYVSKRPWELITNLICLTVQNAIEYERTTKK